MFEDQAIKILNFSEITLTYLFFGFMVVGGIVAGFFSRSKTKIPRTLYFAYSSFLFLCISAFSFIWLLTIPALTGGYLWLLLFINGVLFIIYGYFYGVIAMARSRDAYGNAKQAFLAFIPLANLILLFKASQNKLATSPTITILTGAKGILVGFLAIFAGSALSVFLEREMASLEPTEQAETLDNLLAAQGLETTLKQIASEVFPQQLDETTLLKKVEANKTELSYIYEVSVEIEKLDPSAITALIQQNCNYEFLTHLIKAGTTIKHIYFRLDGSRIDTVTVTRQICNY